MRTAGEVLQAEKRKYHLQLNRQRRVLWTIVGDPSFVTSPRHHPHKPVPKCCVLRPFELLGFRYSMAISKFDEGPFAPAARMLAEEVSPAFHLIKEKTAGF